MERLATAVRFVWSVAWGLLGLLVIVSLAWLVLAVAASLASDPWLWLLVAIFVVAGLVEAGRKRARRSSPAVDPLDKVGQE